MPSQFKIARQKRKFYFMRAIAFQHLLFMKGGDQKQNRKILLLELWLFENSI